MLSVSAAAAAAAAATFCCLYTESVFSWRSLCYCSLLLLMKSSYVRLVQSVRQCLCMPLLAAAAVAAAAAADAVQLWLPFVILPSSMQ